MGINDFRDLEVWQRAMELQLLSYGIARRLPAEERYGLASQIRRAANSIVSNIIEGHAQPTRANYRRYVGDARASSRELHGHFLTADSVGYLDAPSRDDAIALTTRVGQMLTKLHRRLAPPDK